MSEAEFAIAMTHACDGCCADARGWLRQVGAPVAPKPADRVSLWTLHSLYEVDVAKSRMRRITGGSSPTPNFGEDGRWRAYALLTPPAVGFGCIVTWSDGSRTRTSSVVRMETTPL